VVVDVDLFAANVLLDDLLVLDYLLAQANLLLDHRPFLDDDLFLDYRHPDFVVADLDLGVLPVLDRHPLSVDLLPLFGNGETLVVGPYLLAHAYAPGLAFASTSSELFLNPLHPKLVSACELIVAPAIRAAPQAA
jgi:hypothetical protein